MAKIDGTDPTLYMNPSAYSRVKEEKKPGNIRKGEKTSFSTLFDDLKGKTADELGPLQKFPVSDDTVSSLMDSVRDAGDVLINRPLPEEILRYKQAVRNFINYVVQNNYSLEHQAGIPNYLKPGFKGERGTDEANYKKRHTVILVIDKKLEDLAAMLLSGQSRQMELVSRLEEIRGLLVDLLQ